jgi:signal transduction histidine kinase
MGSEEALTTTIVDFVNFALSQKERTGICAILGKIAGALDSCGAILWEPDPDIPLASKDARLFTAGYWFHNDKGLAAHDLSIKKSLAGSAIARDQLVVANNITSDERTAKTDDALRFYNDHQITKCQAAPVHFADGRVGSITLFRTADAEDFATSNPLFLHFCQLLPGLRDSLHHKVSFELIDQVKNILRHSEDEIRDPSQVWLAVSGAVQACFDLIEVSIFLEDPALRPGEFRLAHTTCQEYAVREVYRAEEQGLTNWAIRHQKSVLIWDLRYQKKSKEYALMTNLYPGLVWLDPMGIEEMTSELLQKPKELIPPLSFIAEPIFSGDNVRGVLRCCGVKRAPHYFTQRERGLFGVIASQIGQFWTKWLASRTIHEENKAWNRLVQITALNDSVNSELREPTPTVREILKQGLEATADMIPGAEIIDIRLADETKECLYVAFTHGLDWTEEQKQMRFSLNKNAPQSPGVEVFHSGKVKVLPDVQTHTAYRSAFPRAKALLIVPIRSSNRSYGVIDIRKTEVTQFPQYAVQMAELLGQQLGLYHELIDTVVGLRKTEQQLKEQTRFTNDAFADWQHQIRGPISQAYYRLRETIREDFPNYQDAPQHLQVQSGLLRKARQASRSLQLFLHLSKGESLRTRTQPISRSELTKLLIETCLDNQVLASKRRYIEFIVKIESLKSLESRPLQADKDLLEQALNNVIDNAFKYSYGGTVIDLQASLEHSLFCIAISNIGIVLSEYDVKNIAKRGWRAEEAMAVAGEGAGLGLWVVDHIMRAHGGRLEVLPTLHRRTRVKLLFPWK